MRQQHETYETDTVSIHALFEAYELDPTGTRADTLVHLPGGIEADILEMVKEGPQVFLSVVWFDGPWGGGERQGAILTPTHVKVSWMVH